MELDPQRPKVRGSRRPQKMTIRAFKNNASGVRTLLAMVSLAVLSLSVSARADSQSELGSYVDRLETICKPGTQSTQRAVQGLRSDVQAEHFPLAAAKLAKAARIFDGTVGRISAVPRPRANAAQFTKWFAYLRLQESYL